MLLDCQIYFGETILNVKERVLISSASAFVVFDLKLILFTVCLKIDYFQIFIALAFFNFRSIRLRRELLVAYN